MNNLTSMLETYLMVLVHPFRIHHQFRFGLPIPRHENHLYAPLTLAESVGLSWGFAIIRGLTKILIINFFLQAFISMQTDSFPVLKELMEQTGVSTYYFLLFSAALDLIFFPIGIIIATEFWAWIIRLYAQALDPELPKDEIADQISTHALSSHLFSFIPFVGGTIQFFMYLFLLYAGLRSNLGASRSLATVIILTPVVLTSMFLSLLAFMMFFLVS